MLGPVVPGMGAESAFQFHVGLTKVAFLYRSTEWSWSVRSENAEKLKFSHILLVEMQKVQLRSDQISRSVVSDSL